MLDFFRRYQNYFFIVISIVVIVSFSFFGTYNTLDAEKIRDQVAFTAVDGTQIYRSEIDELSTFLRTDAEDKRILGGIWGPNFLNDGVIAKDILATGLANIFVEVFQKEMDKELQPRLEKEKRYRLYRHPNAPFLSVETAWGYFSPEMKSNFNLLQESTSAIDSEAFSARVALYLSERRLAAPLLKQILKYQQKQYSWLRPDPQLDYIDLSLFGYHTIDDWFSQKFVRIVSEFIINASKIAEEKGYVVTKDEALADLMHNSEISFKNSQNPHLGVKTNSEYFNEQLRRLGLDKHKAIKIWTQVMLFRRLFHDVGYSVFMDSLPSKKFYSYAKETVYGQLYNFSPEFRFSNFQSLQKFEVYLNAISKKGKDLLALPTTLYSKEEIKKKYPELVQKKFTIEVTQVQKVPLQAKVSLKETWQWQIEDKNWQKLLNQFPELAIKSANNANERLALLESLNDNLRARVDAFARAAIVDTHPEWLDEALALAEAKQNTVSIRPSGGNFFIPGLKNREELISLLLLAPIKEQAPETAEAKIALEKLSHYAVDNKVYRISILERSLDEEVLSFAEANREGVLDDLLEKELEKYYIENRESKLPELKQEKGWSPLSEAKHQVATLYFSNIVEAIRKDYSKAKNDTESPKLSEDQAATLRFYQLSRNVQWMLKKGDEAKATAWIQQEQQKPTLLDQWKLVKTPYNVDRSTDSEEIDIQGLFNLTEKHWSKIYTPANGDIYFFHLDRIGEELQNAEIANKVYESQQLISNDAQAVYLKRLLNKIKTHFTPNLNELEEGPEIEPSHDA